MVSRQFSLENLPGRTNESYAFCPGDGLLFRGNEAGSPFGGPRADVGDKVGCGIKFTPVQSQGKNAFPIGGAASGQLFFTHNSKEVGSTPVNIPPGGYFPAFSMTDCLSVVTRCGLRYIQEEDIMMMVDNCDDDWLNLHDIRLNGPVLEYIGMYKGGSCLRRHLSVQGRPGNRATLGLLRTYFYYRRIVGSMVKSAPCHNSIKKNYHKKRTFLLRCYSAP